MSSISRWKCFQIFFFRFISVYCKTLIISEVKKKNRKYISVLNKNLLFEIQSPFAGNIWIALNCLSIASSIQFISQFKSGHIFRGFSNIFQKSVWNNRKDIILHFNRFLTKKKTYFCKNVIHIELRFFLK